MNNIEIGSPENMDVRKFRIYFGHPKNTYWTIYELNCLKKIKELYPEYEIINPRDIDIVEEDNNPKGYATFMIQMQKYYFPAIETCNLMMVAKTRRGKISPGVQKEIGFARIKNIPVEYLDVSFTDEYVTVCRRCGNSDNDEHEWYCKTCGNRVIQCWICQDGMLASYIRDDEEHPEVLCEGCANDMISFDKNGVIDKKDSRMGFRRITKEEFRSGNICWNYLR